MSKFQSLLDVAKNRKPSTPKKKTVRTKAVQQIEAPVISTRARRGRPTGKRSDPDYEQITAYIRRDTHKDVKIALLQEGQGKEFSELVEDLLSGWLGSRT